MLKFMLKKLCSLQEENTSLALCWLWIFYQAILAVVYRLRPQHHIDISWVDWVFYLWSHVLSTAPTFILWWWHLEILFAPLHRSSPFIEGKQFKRNTVRILYSRKNPKSSPLYIVRWLCNVRTNTVDCYLDYGGCEWIFNLGRELVRIHLLNVSYTVYCTHSQFTLIIFFSLAILH
jgi:hypothetical protein